jgi:hypothetical protein
MRRTSAYNKDLSDKILGSVNLKKNKKKRSMVK